MVLLKRDRLANKSVGLVETGYERPADTRFFKPPVPNLYPRGQATRRRENQHGYLFAMRCHLSNIRFRLHRYIKLENDVYVYVHVYVCVLSFFPRTVIEISATTLFQRF